MSGAAVLGVDPGTTGGACLVSRSRSGPVPLEWWTWRPEDGRYRVVHRTNEGGKDSTDVPSLSVLGHLLAAKPRTATVLESLHVPAPREREGLGAYRGRLASLLILAESRGELKAHLQLHPGPLHEPRAGGWRSTALGIPPNTPREAAEGLARALALRLHKRFQGTSIHAIEAYWMAVYGLAVTRQAKLPLLPREAETPPGAEVAER